MATFSLPSRSTRLSIQVESGDLTVLDQDANTNDTLIRDAAHPETSPVPGGGTLRPGFTGTGYLDFGDTPGDRVSFNLDVAEAGSYDLNIRYASQIFGSGPRSLDIGVNAGGPGIVAFPDTGPAGGAAAQQGFNVWGFLTRTVTLAAGTNTVTLAIPAGASTGPNVDRIELTPAGTGPIPADSSADADGNLFLDAPDAPLSGAALASVNFTISGVDADIVALAISFDGGVTRTDITGRPDADGDFVFDASHLSPGAVTATVYVTDQVGNVASATAGLQIAAAVDPATAIVIQAEDTSRVTVQDTGSPASADFTRVVDGAHPDSGGNVRAGAAGGAYMDFGGNAGDAISVAVSVAQTGVYDVTFRYGNGGAGNRPLLLAVDGGNAITVNFPPAGTAGSGTGATGWNAWGEVTLPVTLGAGDHVLRLSIPAGANSGPNIDQVTLQLQDEPGGPGLPQVFGEVVRVNFEPAAGAGGLPAGYATPAGYEADTGAAFGSRGGGFSYGWVTEASVADGTANGTIAAALPTGALSYRNTVPGATALQKTLAQMEQPAAGAAGARAWEIALENGTYQLSLSIGDSGGPFDSTYAVNVEGLAFGRSWVPANPGGNGAQDGGGFRSTLQTGIVQVTDGRLTIDSIGGTNTELQYLEIERVPDLTPSDGRSADRDYSYFVGPVAAYLNEQVPISIGAGGALPIGINPLSSFVVGVNLQAPGHRGPNVTRTDGVTLVETLTGLEVPLDVQISGGADSLTLRPLQDLKPFTGYTLMVRDVLDLGSITDGAAPLRQMQDLTTSFVTGATPVNVAREVGFNTQVLLNGFIDGAAGFTSITFGPDGKLYVATITGEIHRWSVLGDGSLDKASQETLSLGHFDQGAAGRRGIIGMVFDPTNPDVIWVSDNYPIPRENKAFSTPEFSGRISKIELGAGGSFSGATAEAYITGLPRSGGDHVTNSLAFRANPDAGQAGEPAHLLYVTQGSNSSGGSADNAWGNRPERLLNAAVLEIDPSRDAPAGGFDVRTEPVTDPTTSNPPSSFNADGTYPGFYNPYAADAVLSIYASGVRNAYDLVWHSNGHLYAPTNGSAVGPHTPEDPTQPGDQVIDYGPKQKDYLFTISEGKYYGHPNVLRDQYILNGGNPTAGEDPNEVVAEKDGTPGTDGYDVGVLPDPAYDLAGTYDLGYNQSPNGAIEYRSNVFGESLKGAILVAQFSIGDNVRMVRLDAGGAVIGDDVLRRPDGSVIDDYIDPLDIVEDPATGQLYLMTLNRGTGASQLVLLSPVPGAVVSDVTADEGGDLTLSVVDGGNPASVLFQIGGADADLVGFTVSLGGGAARSVTPDAQGRFSLAVAAGTAVTAQLEVTDGAGNRATASTLYTPPQQPAQLVSLVTIQAEDNTPGDGTAVGLSSGAGAQIQIRTAANPESGSGLVNGLRPGAFGLDGNTVNTDGVPGGYADFGALAGDFVTFTFAVPAAQAGSGLIRVRYGNGGATDRPLDVLVNGVSTGVRGFGPPAGQSGDAAWATWQILEVPANLVSGTNTVSFRATANTGPNIDQIEVLAPAAPPQPQEPYVFLEAEAAALVGARVVTENRNQSGAFVDYDGTADQSITWTVEAPQAGIYEIGVRYALAAGKGDRPLALAVNEAPLGALSFPGFSNAAESEWRFQTTTVELQQGDNTIRLTAPNAVGPNVDQLRVATSPAQPAFQPDYAAISGETRIELEQTATHATRIVNARTVDFYFTPSASGAYLLDLAANAGAPNGQGLTLYLNDTLLADLAFPGSGTAGEVSTGLSLTAGQSYHLRVVSDAPGANALDYLDLRPAPAGTGRIAVQALDATFFDDRLQFSYLEDPNAQRPDLVDRAFKSSGVVRVTNSGEGPLAISGATLDGPFSLANPAALSNLSLAAGQSVDVTVLFNRALYTPPTSNVDLTSTIFEGHLRINTNDPAAPQATVQLAGFWQARDEGGQEPNVNEVWKVFGFGNVIEGLSTRGGGENSVLNDFDLYRSADATEVLSPYWRIADGYTAATATHIAAYHGNGGASFAIHNPGNKFQQSTLWTHDGNDNQTLLPLLGNGGFSSRSFTAADIPDAWAGNDVFGMSIDSLSTDPRLNPAGGGTPPAGTSGIPRGYTHRIFQAVDQDGDVIPNVYLGVMDYTGINYDYNDNMTVIEGITPVGFGQQLVVAGLDDAAADERLVFSRIDNPANASQAFRDEAVVTLRNDGSAALGISGVTLDDPNGFQLIGTAPATLAPGASVSLTLRFTGTHAGTAAGAQLYESSLTIHSTDFTQGQKVIALSGLAQEFSENNSEPNVAQIVEAFGYDTNVAQAALAGGGRVETIGDEVLMPYLERLDGGRPVEVVQLAAMLNQGAVARLGTHTLSSGQTTNLLANDDQQGQTLLPDSLVAGAGAGASVARASFSPAAPFGLHVTVDGRPTYASWSDPQANRLDPALSPLVGADQGHLIRFFQARDGDGQVIAGSYIGVQDYPGGANYDYNDLVFLITNVRPHALTALEDADRNGVLDVLQRDTDQDGLRDFFDIPGVVA
ncbi:carbohydrate-binding protein [Teichococcus aerofrigidensis]